MLASPRLGKRSPTEGDASIPAPLHPTPAPTRSRPLPAGFPSKNLPSQGLLHPFMYYTIIGLAVSPGELFLAWAIHNLIPGPGIVVYTYPFDSEEKQHWHPV